MSNCGFRAWVFWAFPGFRLIQTCASTMFACWQPASEQPAHLKDSVELDSELRVAINRHLHLAPLRSSSKSGVCDKV